MSSTILRVAIEICYGIILLVSPSPNNAAAARHSSTAVMMSQTASAALPVFATVAAFEPVSADL